MGKIQLRGVCDRAGEDGTQVLRERDEGEEMSASLKKKKEKKKKERN